MMITGLQAYSQKYRSVEDTTRLNREYVKVTNNIVELNAKLVIAQIIYLVINLKPLKQVRVPGMQQTKALTRLQKLIMAMLVMQEKQKERPGKHIAKPKIQDRQIIM